MGKTIPLSLPGFCFHLVTPLHVIVTKLFRPRHPGRILARTPQDCFCEGEPCCQEASGSTLRHSDWDWETSLWLQLSPVGTSLNIHRALRQSQLSVGLLFLKTGC